MRVVATVIRSLLHQEGYGGADLVVGDVAVAEYQAGLASAGGAIGVQVRDPDAAGERATLDRGWVRAAFEAAEEDDQVQAG
jgi:hypothetical protein